jgi:NADPH-dependent curcumin reductase CurA
LTAYFGITKVCQPKPGETLVVSSAAGAVGSVAGQIGKIMGCRVIGLTGTDEKVEWLKLIGFDQAYNYRKVNVGEVFKNEVKQGIDCYFDNVGNDITFHVTKNMNFGGRIALCGSGGVYHDHDDPSKALVPLDYAHVIGKGIRMQGFTYNQYEKEFPSAINQLRDWIVEDALKVRETLDNGIESLPQALIEVLQGHNIGKRVVKMWNPPIVT